MFIGQYEHNLEEKGRLSVPKKFRADLSEGGVLTRGLDGCLFLFPKKRWEEFVEKLSQTPLTKADARGFARLLTYGATEIEIDGQGRMLLPEFLRRFAGIKKEVVLAGAIERVEIWSKENFTAYQERIEKESINIAERLAELGII
ncbi:MAG: division/cell wall cluster transcriptional repressor MraZ [bacterium]|nr:division/cell wall cluster transcriptional repressor MraZ [bacterium]